MLFQYTGIDSQNKRVRGFVRAENRKEAREKILEEENISIVLDLKETVDNKRLNAVREKVIENFSSIEQNMGKKVRELQENREVKERERTQKKRERIYAAGKKTKQSGNIVHTVSTLPVVGMPLARAVWSIQNIGQNKTKESGKMVRLRSENDMDAEEELMNIFREEREEFGELGVLPNEYAYMTPPKEEAGELDWSLIDLDGNGNAPDEDVDLEERFKVKVKTEAIIMMTRRLQIMLSSGVSLINGIEILAESEEGNPHMQKMLNKIATDIQMGLSFSQALAKFPEQFDNSYISLVSIGETSGSLEDSLVDVIEVLEQEEEIRKQLKSAAIYPAIIGGVLAIVMVLGSMFFIPMFEDIFVDLGEGELPGLTKAVFAIAGYVPWIAGGTILALVGYMFVKSRSKALDRRHRQFMSKLALKFPVIKDVVLIYNMHTFSNTVGTMIKNGVQLNKALAMAQQAIDNVYIKNEIAKSNLMMTNGYSLSESLREQTYFDSVLINIILVGEETGEMDFALSEISRYYQEELTRKIEDLMSMVQPVSMILIGVLAAPVIIAIYMPILEMSSGAGM